MFTSMVLAATLVAQVVAPVVLPGQSLKWNFNAAELAVGPVVRFELQVDTNPWTDVGLPNATPVSGDVEYSTALPAMTPGLHTLNLRACSVDICGNAAVKSVKLVVVPVTPRDLQIK
jgi:hypothetical protein